MTDDQVPPETIAKLREIFVELGCRRAGRPATEWTDDEVVVAARAVIKVLAEVGRKVRAAMVPVIQQLGVQLREMTISEPLATVLLERAQLERRRCS